MNRPMTLPMALIAIFLSAATTLGQALPDGPYFGQTPPGITPQLFAPGIVSLPTRRETKIVFSPDGREAFLGTVINGGFTIQMTTQTDGHWSPLATPAFIGVGNAQEPFIAPDGNHLFFVRQTNIWSAVRQNGIWSTATPLPAPINTTAEEWYPSVASDGTLYFLSSRGNPAGGYNIWQSTLAGGVYAAPERLSSLINSPTAGATDPWIAPDSSYLLFGSRVAGGFGQVDQYLSLRQPDGSWGSRINLGSAINTSAIEYASSVSPDGKYYFFSRPSAFSPFATGDIYWVDARAAGLPVPEPAAVMTLTLAFTWVFLRRHRPHLT